MKLESQSSSNKKIQIFSAVILNFLILGIYSCISNNDVMYLVDNIIAYDNSYFPNNLLRYGDSISPKWFSDLMSGFLFHFIDWKQERLITYFLVAIILSLAFTNFSVRFGINNIIPAVILMSIMSLQSVSGRLALYTINRIDGTYEILGLSVGILAVSFCFGKPRYNIALFLASLAGLFHIHEGMYSGAFVVFLWLIKRIVAVRNIKELNENIDLKEIMYGFLIWFITILVLVIPPLITNKTIYTSREYIDKYVKTRFATHIIPFYWGSFNIFTQYIIWGSIILFIYFYGCKRKNEKEISRKYIYYAVGFISLCSGIIVLSSLFTDLFPVRFFANLFVSKVFRYIGFILTVMLAGTIDTLLYEKKFTYFAIGIILLLPLSQWSIIVLLPAVSLYICFNVNRDFNTVDKISSVVSAIVFLISIGILLYFYIKNNNITITYDFGKMIQWMFVLLSGIVIDWCLSDKKIIKKRMLCAIVGGGNMF